MRHYASVILCAAVLGAVATAQTCGPTPTMQANAWPDGVFLDIDSSLGSTNSRATTPDYAATVGVGQSFTVRILSTTGSPGESIGIYFSIGGPQTPLNFSVPGKNVFLDLGQSGIPFPLNFLVFAEGPGFNGNTFGLVTQQAPAVTTITGIVPPLASLAGQCLVVQAATARNSAPGGFALSNAVTIEILPTVVGLSPSQLLTEGASITANVPGAGANDNAYLSDGFGGTIAAAAAGGAFTVPLGAASGPVGYSFGGIPTSTAPRNPDRVASWFTVTDGVINATPPGLILPNPSLVPGLARFTNQQTLATAAQIDDYTVNLLPGDVVEIEVLSIDSGATTILDGYGSGQNALATQGFNPRVTLRQLANTLPLVFDTGLAAPFDVHTDDDAGPGGNAFLRFQARTQDTFGIRVQASTAGGFVSGLYILNVRVHSASLPAVTTVGSAVATPTNVVTPGATVALSAANLVFGQSYNIVLTPTHGFFPPTVVAANASSATAISFSAPATLAAGTFTVGSYRVQIEDPLTQRRSLLWPTTPLRPQFGVVPDLIVVRAATTTAPGAGLTPLAANTGTMLFNAAGAGGFAQFTASPGQRIYVEAVGIDPLQTLRVDSAFAFSGVANGVWNPNMILFSGTGLGTIIGFNDDDGIQPFVYLPQAAGIGDGAAILVNSDAPAGNANFVVLVQENLCWVNCTQVKVGLLNVVVQ